MNVFNFSSDLVVSGICSLGQTDYDYTLKNILPLISKLDEQRKLLDTKFYKRLERDILNGCLMPPLTLAFIETDNKSITTKEGVQKYVEKNISHGFILDGIQRLNTLERASESGRFNPAKEIFFNIIITDKKDKLLYRMITLNNGQKGMTPRHQIEILTKELFDFSDLDITIQTEKDKSTNPIPDSFSLGDVVKGYMAFLTNNVNNENSKIIEEKMDEILVGRILDNDEILMNDLEFYNILEFVNKHASNKYCLKWFQTVNNFIGFSVGFKNSFQFLNSLNSKDLQSGLEKFELAFKALNPSKINLGKFRRELSKYYVGNLEHWSTKSLEEIEELFFDLTSTD